MGNTAKNDGITTIITHVKRAIYSSKINGTPLKMILLIRSFQLIKVCLYDCVCCNYGSLMFNLLSSVSTVHCHLCTSLCYLGNALLMSLLKMVQWIDLNEWRQFKIKCKFQLVLQFLDHHSSFNLSDNYCVLLCLVHISYDMSTP